MSTKISQNLEKYEASITGMRCSGCSNYLESSLKKINFIKSVTVNLITEKALLVIDTEILQKEKEKNSDNDNENQNESENDILETNSDIIKSNITKLNFGVNNISKINEENNDEKYLQNPACSRSCGRTSHTTRSRRPPYAQWLRGH